MKFLLPLLCLSLNCIGQDTTYYFNTVYKVTSVYSFENKHLSTRFDTLNLKGATMPLKRVGDTYYLGTAIADTLIRISSTTDIQQDTIHGVCTVGTRLYDTILVSKMESISFKGNITGFFVEQDNLCNWPIVYHLLLYYPDKPIPEKGTKTQYLDYQVIRYDIGIIKRAGSYSN